MKAMKRIQLSKYKVNNIIELRQNGYSFLAIEKETGIPRRTAQRVYQEWEEKSSWEDLKRVRSKVVDREFSQHLDLLTRLAQRLVTGMDVWITGDIPPPAEEHLVAIWTDEINDSLVTYLQKSQYDRRERTRLQRQYHMLFQALQKHTGKDVSWPVLEKWKGSWDRYRTALPDLREQLSAIVEKLYNEEPDRWVGIIPDQGDEPTVEFIAGGILKTVLQGMVEERPRVEVFDWKVLSPESPDANLRLRETKGFWILSVPTAEGTELIKETCESAVDQVWDGETMNLMQKERRTIQEAVDTLDEQLDPLRLRPLILNSRCDLCPV